MTLAAAASAGEEATDAPRGTLEAESGLDVAHAADADGPAPGISATGVV